MSAYYVFEFKFRKLSFLGFNFFFTPIWEGPKTIAAKSSLKLISSTVTPKNYNTTQIMNCFEIRSKSKEYTDLLQR